MIDISNNRRKEGRIRSLKGGRIIFNQRTNIMDCMVRNISGSGAKLVVSVPVALPDDFDLRFEDGKEQSCSVRWRNVREFGVEFRQNA